VKIYFRTRELQELCSHMAVMQKKLGALMARKLSQRLAELHAAETLAVIPHTPPARRHLLTEGVDQGKFSVDLAHPMRLLFIPANDPIPYLAAGGYAIDKITEIEIVAIKDTHQGNK
jgi:hypothetical protein